MKLYLILLIIFSGTIICDAQRRSEFYLFEGISIKKGDTVFINEGSMGGQFVFIYTVWGNIPPMKLPYEGKNTWIIIEYFRRKKEDDRKIIYAVGYLPMLKNAKVFVDVEGAFKSGEVALYRNGSG